MIRIGTRSSAMALAQTREVARLIAEAWPDAAPEIVKFTPEGDRDQVSKLQKHGGKGGAFVAEIRAAVRAGKLEAAMHSLKDVPGDEETPGLVLAAFLPREPGGDALIVRDPSVAEALEKNGGRGVMIGTNSVRRAAYLKRLYPECAVIHFRGAVDTRLRKLDEGMPQKLPGGGSVGPADALIVAEAGLYRLGLEGRIARRLSVDEMLPAVGQGVITVECAEADWETRRRLAKIDDAATRAAALAERELLWVLNGHCNSPIAGQAKLANGRLVLRAAVISLDGARVIEARGEGAGERPRELGRAVALDLLRQGAAAIIEESRL